MADGYTICSIDLPIVNRRYFSRCWINRCRYIEITYTNTGILSNCYCVFRRRADSIIKSGRKTMLSSYFIGIPHRHCPTGGIQIAAAKSERIH